jgi:hypothetical protein
MLEMNPHADGSACTAGYLSRNAPRLAGPYVEVLDSCSLALIATGINAKLARGFRDTRVLRRLHFTASQRGSYRGL